MHPMDYANDILRRIVIIGLLFLVAPVGTACGQTAVGITAGVNRANLNGDIPDRLSYRNHLGPAFGAIVEFDLSDDTHLSLQPMYMQRGSNVGYKPAGSRTYQDSIQVKLDYIAVPILAKVFIGSGKAFVTGGLDIAYLLDAVLQTSTTENDAQARVTRFDLAADFGIGVALPVGSSDLTFELRYQQSLLNLANNDDSGSDDIFPKRLRASGLQLFASWLWPLGGD